MILSTTGGYNTGAFYSQGNLKSPYKGGESKRICNSEPFIKPKMSHNKKIWDCCTSKLSKLTGPLFPKDKKTVVLLSMNQLRKSVQMPITCNNTGILQQKNMPKLSLIKQQAKSEQKPDKAEIQAVQESRDTSSQKIEAYSQEIQAAKRHKQIPKSEWDSITRPSAKVILDPNTANPNLKITVDGRSVRTKTYKEFHSSQSFHEYERKNKHHYNGWTCVQAQEGYTTGSHYWTVDVKGKCDWRLGVVKESAPRNGFINLNTAVGYWTLRLQLGLLMALTEPVTKLNQALPSKIGVLLDMEAGQVSFYDAVKRETIYTFNAEFEKDEKIYPVFGTVETDKPLKII